MRDKRIRRRHATEPIEVSSKRLQGQVLNMSLGGLAIETTTAVRPGEKLSLKIDGEGITVTGRVRWSKLHSLRRGEGGDSQPIYRAGIRRVFSCRHFR